MKWGKLFAIQINFYLFIGSTHCTCTHKTQENAKLNSSWGAFCKEYCMFMQRLQTPCELKQLLCVHRLKGTLSRRGNFSLTLQFDLKSIIESISSLHFIISTTFISFLHALRQLWFHQMPLNLQFFSTFLLTDNGADGNEKIVYGIKWMIGWSENFLFSLHSCKESNWKTFNFKNVRFSRFEYLG